MQRIDLTGRMLTTVSLIGFWIATLMGTTPLHPERAMAATPVADCSGIEAYIDVLSQIRDDFRAAFIERLPDAPRPWELDAGASPNGALDPGALAWMNWIMWVGLADEEEVEVLAQLWEEAAERLRAVESPPYAREYHAELVSAAQSWADGYRKEGAMLGLAMMIMPGVGADPSSAASSEELAARCPAWAAFQAESLSPATPVPG